MEQEMQRTRLAKMDTQLRNYISTKMPSRNTKEHCDVVGCLNDMASFWISQLATAGGQTIPVKKRSYIRAFGSYGLGLGGGRDLDAVLVAPAFVRRDEFFVSFVNVLSQEENVRDVCVVENAFVPVVKFIYYGVEMDLTFAVLAMNEVPEEEALLRSDEVIKGMDEKSVRSLNGWRVCRFILDYVPDVVMFRDLLQLVKHWAIRRQIYSNTCGYLGGVSWAIMVAKVCKLEKLTSLTASLEAFMKIFTEWNWALTPVQLQDEKRPDDRKSEELEPFDPWALTKEQLMRIHTPSFPYQNSSFNVSRSTFKVIQEEMRAALTTLHFHSLDWESFFSFKEPWTEYSNYLLLVASSPSEALFRRWKGFVESKLLQKLMYPLEMLHGMKKCQIYPTPFQHGPDEEGQVHCDWAIGVETHINIAKQMVEVFRDYRNQINFLRMSKVDRDLLKPCHVDMTYVSRNQLMAVFTLKKVANPFPKGAASL